MPRIHEGFLTASGRTLVIPNVLRVQGGTRFGSVTAEETVHETYDLYSFIKSYLIENSSQTKSALVKIQL